MNPNIFDNVPRNHDSEMDIYWANGVMKTLYELEGGDKLYQQRKNENRLIEIDHYYIAKYKAETRILQTVVFFCCLAMVGSVLFNVGFISLLMYTSYVGIVGILMLYFVLRDIYRIYSKDSQNFDEIDYSLYYKKDDLDISGTIYNTAELSNLPSCPS